MTRGVRSRPLIEPEPDPPVVVITDAGNGTNDAPTTSGRDEQGKWIPGHAFAGGGRPRGNTLTEVLRRKADPAFLARRLLQFCTYDGPVGLQAVTYVYDRLDGKPIQQAQLLDNDGGPSFAALMIAGLTGQPLPQPPTLIETPVSQEQEQEG